MATQNYAQANQPRKNDDYNLTLCDVCESLGKSTRTITRYVQKRILHPRAVKSCQGTLEYRFSESEIRRVRNNEKNLRPYLFSESGQPSPLPDYAAASFAACGYAPPVPPPQAFLVPGASFPMQQNHFPQIAAPQFYPQMPPQNFDLGAVEIDDDLRTRKDGARRRKDQSSKKDAPLQAAKNEEPPSRANEEIVLLLKETTEMLRGQLKTKDDQIKNLDDKIGQLIERNRETNILLKGLQDKIMLLEQPKQKREVREKPAVLPSKEEGLPRAKEIDPEDRQVVMMAKAVPQETQKVANHELPVPVPNQKNFKTPDDSKKKGLFGKIFG